MILKNVDLTNYNTFGISQQASALFEFVDNDELITFLNESENEYQRFMPIGEGSNLLFTKMFEGCLLKSQNNQIKILEENTEFVWVKTGAGVEWDSFVEWAVNQNLYGVENLSLIPGTTGASAIQNIGAYGVEVKDCVKGLETIHIATKKERVFDAKECNYGYRESIFKNALAHQFMITSVIYRLSKIANYNLSYGAVKQEVDKLGTVSLENVRNTIIKIRNSKLPNHKLIGNAGSFFKNPIVLKATIDKLLADNPNMPVYQVNEEQFKLAAGWLIDQCGFKGYTTTEGAAVHDKQALVLVNKGVKSGESILKLSQQISNTVNERFGVNLTPEVIIL